MYNATSLTSLYHDMDLKHSEASRLLCIFKSSCPVPLLSLISIATLAGSHLVQGFGNLKMPPKAQFSYIETGFGSLAELQGC